VSFLADVVRSAPPVPQGPPAVPVAVVSGPPEPRPVVAVVGGGIAGLAAAWELVTAGAAAGSDRTGGPRPRGVGQDRRKMRSTEFAGRRVDLAADGFSPGARGDRPVCRARPRGHLVAVGASGASIWARGRLRMMPEG